MGKIVKQLKKLVIGHKVDSKSFIEFLRKKGVKVGKGVEIFRPFNTNIDTQNPHLLSIGDYVMMTGTGIVKKCAVGEYPKSWIGRSQAA